MQLAAMIALNEEAGRTFLHEAELEQRVSDLTPTEVHAALLRNLSLENLIIVKAGQFAGIPVR